MEKIIVYIVVYVVVIALIMYCFFLSKRNDIKWVVFVKKHLNLLLIILAANTISFSLSLKDNEADYYIKRQDVDGNEREYSFQISENDEEKGFTIEVEPKRLKPKDAEKKMQKAFDILDKSIAGENDCLDHITKDLSIHLDYSIYPFDMEVRSSDYGLIDDEGVVRNDDEHLKMLGYEEKDLLSGIPASISVKLRYKDLEKEKNYDLIIFPKEKSEFEKLVESTRQMYERKEKETVYEDGFVLPSEYEGVRIIFPENEAFDPKFVLFIGIIIAIFMLVREVEGNRNKEMRRRQELLQAYPWFINEMVLLMGAGMQIRNVFSLLINDYERENIKDDYRRALINELTQARHDFEIGMSEGRIYYELGRRLKLPCYIKVLTLLEQNVTKGSKGIVAVLEQEEKNALEERMNIVKKRGEEAGTKLLGPMILLLLVIMLMIMIPAFLSFV